MTSDLKAVIVATLSEPGSWTIRKLYAAAVAVLPAKCGSVARTLRAMVNSGEIEQYLAEAVLCYRLTEKRYRARESQPGWYTIEGPHAALTEEEARVCVDALNHYDRLRRR
jgi:hypothetical protein